MITLYCLYFLAITQINVKVCSFGCLSVIHAENAEWILMKFTIQTGYELIRVIGYFLSIEITGKAAGRSWNWIILLNKEQCVFKKKTSHFLLFNSYFHLTFLVKTIGVISLSKSNNKFYNILQDHLNAISLIIIINLIPGNKNSPN